jgi:folylpolyglutamate synthase/dihydropteroate synthase
MEVGALAAEIRKRFSSVETAETVEEAVIKARKTASPDDLVLITGSLYVVGDARALFFPAPGSSGALSGLKG